ncbi:MAG: PQQ-binding-like beta-propeller repeat protein [Ktedonobacterales bacterium]
MAPDDDSHTVYAGSAAGIVFAFDPSTGAVRWQASGVYNIAPAPAAAAGAVFVCDDGGNVRALRASDGAPGWVGSANGAVFAPPVLV